MLSLEKDLRKQQAGSQDDSGIILVPACRSEALSGTTVRDCRIPAGIKEVSTRKDIFVAGYIHCQGTK